MSSKSSNRERLKYGVCLNEECSKAKAKEVQAISMRKELVCLECGKPLRECPPPTSKGVGKYIGIAAGVLAVLGGGGYGAYYFMNKDSDIEQETETVIEDNSSKTDAEIAKTPETTQKYDYKLSWGTYEGKMQNGVPHGIGGEVTVTSSFCIDFKDGKGGKTFIGPGDRIANCKFVEGRFVSGIIHHANGQQESVNVGI